MSSFAISDPELRGLIGCGLRTAARLAVGLAQGWLRLQAVWGPPPAVWQGPKAPVWRETTKGRWLEGLQAPGQGGIGGL